jgi:hypothetical protein
MPFLFDQEASGLAENLVIINNEKIHVDQAATVTGGNVTTNVAPSPGTLSK